jgi:methionyl-tRNA formyltransferase
VVSCHEYAWETVRELSKLDGVEVVGFLQGELPRARVLVRIQRFLRVHGPRVVQAAAYSIARKLRGAVGGHGGRSSSAVRDVPHVRLRSLNTPEAIEALVSLKPDLMVVDGANILQPDFFARPRYGAINLHCGKLPDFRGMPPAFWELYHGVPEVGVSVHSVSARLDEGAVLATAAVPLDLAPPGDPVTYVARFWRERLRPVGIQLIAHTVRSIADGTAAPTPQPPASRPPFRSPSFSEQQELRRRVALRRNGMV